MRISEIPQKGLILIDAYFGLLYVNYSDWYTPTTARAGVLSGRYLSHAAPCRRSPVSLALSPVFSQHMLITVV